MLPRETTNSKGMRLDAAKVVVKSAGVSQSNPIRIGSDIVVLLGFLPGPHERYELIPVGNVSQFISNVLGDLSDETAVQSFKRTEIYRSIVACRQNGGRDICVFKLGDTSELEDMPDDDHRMQLIYDRLNEGLPLAADIDWIGYLVPVDAPAEGYQRAEMRDVILDENGDPVLDGEGNPTYTVTPAAFLDFMAITASACATAMASGGFVQALLSTAESNGTLWMNSESLRRKEAWQLSSCYSPALHSWVPGNDKYRFVAVPTGRALFSSLEYGAFFEQGLAPALAGLLSSLPDDVSAVGREIRVSKPISPVLGSTADNLSVAGYIPVGQTAMMRRRKAEGAVLLGDNTMAVPGSDFKQEIVMRLARRVSLRLRLALEKAIGTNGSQVEYIVTRTMNAIQESGSIRGYSYRFDRDPKDIHRMRVYVEIYPYLPVKAIEISIVAGPFV